MVRGPPKRTPNGSSSSRSTIRAAVKEEKKDCREAAARREASIKAADRTSPSVLWRPLEIGYWDETNSLDLEKNNWQKWSRLIEYEFDMMQIPDAMDYLNGTFNIPDAELEPCAYKNYRSNDKVIASFLKLRCAEEEQILVFEMPTAKQVWDFLKDRHTRHQTLSRILAWDELYSIRFDTTTGAAGLVEQWQDMVQLIERIQSMGKMTKWDHLMVGVLSSTRAIPVLYSYFRNQISIAAQSDHPEKVFNGQDVERRLRMHADLQSWFANTTASATNHRPLCGKHK